MASPNLQEVVEPGEGHAMPRNKGSIWQCCCKAPVKHEEIGIEVVGLPKERSVEAKQQAAHANVIYVRTCETSSSGGSGPVSANTSPTLTRPSSDASITSNVWHDCAEDWDTATGTCSSTCSTDVGQQHRLGQGQYAGLPAMLADMLSKYQRGSPMGCKPTGALLKYMEDTGTSLEQLKQQLLPITEAEDPDLPTPTLRMQPSERTQALQDTARQQQQQASTSSSTQQQQLCKQPTISRLLGNIELIQQTLSGLAREDGFKQVSWGALQLWYMHDTVNHRQVIKAKVVLEEDLVNVVCLAREVDLVTSWNPAISDMAELASYSPSELLIYMLLWVPWPLFAPEIVNLAIGVDLLHTREECVLVATKYLSGELPNGVGIPQHPRAQRLTMDAGGFLFKPLPPDPARPNVPLTETTVLVSIDAKKWTVPEAIISFVLKVFSPLVYRSVVKVLKRMFHTGTSATDGDASGSALMDRLALRPEYASIAANVRRYLNKNAAAAASFAH